MTPSWHNTVGALNRPGRLARCWTAQQHTVDRGDVNRSWRARRHAVIGLMIGARGGLFRLVLRRYD
jgi:hypothetical protein